MELDGEHQQVQPEGTGRKMRHSQSFLDVAEVGASNGTAPPPAKKAKRGSVCNLLEGNMKAVQEHENEIAEVVIVCEPESSSLTMGALHPRGSLYERPINIDSAKTMHAEFRRVLREHGLRVLTVREILAYGTDEHMGARVELEDLAMDAMTYELDSGHKMEDVQEEDRFYLSDDYKRRVVEHMSVAQVRGARAQRAAWGRPPSRRRRRRRRPQGAPAAGAPAARWCTGSLLVRRQPTPAAAAPLPGAADRHGADQPHGAPGAQLPRHRPHRHLHLRAAVQPGVHARPAGHHLQGHRHGAAALAAAPARGVRAAAGGGAAAGAAAAAGCGGRGPGRSGQPAAAAAPAAGCCRLPRAAACAPSCPALPRRWR
jgi:hypothetical protein